MSDSIVQILIPIYNEGENVRRVYQDLLAANVVFDRLSFVYDRDDDTSLPYIAKINASDPRVVADKNGIRPGVIHALQWGFSRAQAGPVIVVMGDSSDKLTIIPEMIELWRTGATIVSPSRYMKGGQQHGGGLVKSTLSRCAGLSLFYLGFPTSDPTNNFKLYDGTWLKQQQIQSAGGFEVALELCYKAYQAGLKIVQLPTEWFDRTSGESRFNLRKWLPHYLRWYFKCIKAILF